MPVSKWIERSFQERPPVELAPNVIERLRGTAARLGDRLEALPEAVLTNRDGESWTIKENLGHLGDLEPLWLTRHHEILSGAAQMSPADTSNPATWQAGHNGVSLQSLLQRFRSRRRQWIDSLDSLALQEFEKSAQHPRLHQPMRLIDLCLFVAEHDDHHLARISELIRQSQGDGTSPAEDANS